MTKRLKAMAAVVLSVTLAFGMSITSFAQGWVLDSIGWWYGTNADNTTRYTNGWYWIDGDNDGIAECYCFDENGYLLTNILTPDNYLVNADGQWIDANGVVQTQTVTAASSGTSISSGSSGGSGGGSGSSGSPSSSGSSSNPSTAATPLNSPSTFTQVKVDTTGVKTDKDSEGIYFLVPEWNEEMAYDYYLVESPTLNSRGYVTDGTINEDIYIHVNEFDDTVNEMGSHVPVLSIDVVDNGSETNIICDSLNGSNHDFQMYDSNGNARLEVEFTRKDGTYYQITLTVREHNSSIGATTAVDTYYFVREIK